MVDWSALPGSAVALIGRRFQLIEDFIAFRSTCSSWRQATTLKDFSSSSFPKLPLLMLNRISVHDDEDEDEYSVQIYDSRNQRIDPVEERKRADALRAAGRKLASDFLRRYPLDVREFQSLSKGKSCKFTLAEVIRMECRGSKGWLIMVGRNTGNMSLFNPLTRAQIPLPKAPLTVKIPVWPKEFISAVLSASPSETSDYVVMLAFVEPPYISGRYVGFWKPGNQTWTRVEIPHCVEDLSYYNGKFYALTWEAQVWMLDISGPAIKITELPWDPATRPKAQLVECGGRLLIVAPFFDRLCDRPYEHNLEMVEIDVIKGSYSVITSLGSSTVFLGRNEGFSIDANKFPGIIEPNLVYFSDGFYRLAAPGPSPATRPSLCGGVWVNF